MRPPITLPAVLATVLLVAASGRAAEIHGRVVDQEGKPVRDSVVFVDQLPPGMSVPADHRTAVIDQINKTFVPHVLPVMVGTEVSFPNHDQIHHHVYSLSRTKTFEIPLYKGESAPPVLFDQPGAVKLGCNIHDWMSGVILVVPTPYFAVTDDDGKFTLRDVPPGTYGVVAWNEGSKRTPEEMRQMVTVGGADQAVTFTLDVTPPRRQPVARRGYE